MSGVIGILSKESVALDLYYSLYAIQHRGQDTMGVCTIDDGKIYEIKGNGLVSDNVDTSNLQNLKGNMGIAHVNHIFSDEKYKEAMPIRFEDNKMIAIDGRITNSDFSYEELKDKIFGDEKALVEYVASLTGAFAIIAMDENAIVAIRDTRGIKPLSVGKREDFFIVSSETCAFDAIGANKYKDLVPGEIFIMKKNEIKSIYAEKKGHELCLFEMFYVQRPDSNVDGVSVHKARFNSGEILFNEMKTEADIVVGAPDSGSVAALGYANASGISYQPGLVKNRYIARTFISSDEILRKNAVRLKLNAVREIVNGKDVILVDDSIVRGTTIRHTVEALRMGGARKVHVRIASPPIMNTDNVSVDIPDKSKLVGYGKTVEEIRKEIGCDSLYYISIEGLREACGNLGFYENYFQIGD